jgi:hypothetical protein
MTENVAHETEDELSWACDKNRYVSKTPKGAISTSILLYQKMKN